MYPLLTTALHHGRVTGRKKHNVAFKILLITMQKIPYTQNPAIPCKDVIACFRSYAFPFQLRNHEAQHVNKLISHFKATERETSNFDKK